MNYAQYKKLIQTFSSLNNSLAISGEIQAQAPPGNESLDFNSITMEVMDEALSLLNNGGVDGILEEFQDRTDRGLPEKIQAQDLRVLLSSYQAKVEELFGEKSQLTSSLIDNNAFYQIKETSPLWGLFKLYTKALFLDSSVRSLLQGMSRFSTDPGKKQRTPGRKPGKSFRDCLTPGRDSEEILRTFHNLIDGKTGKDVARIIRAGKNAKILVEIPSAPAITKEFGDCGSVSNLLSFLEDGRDWRGELDALEEIFRAIK